MNDFDKEEIKEEIKEELASSAKHVKKEKNSHFWDVFKTLPKLIKYT